MNRILSLPDAAAAYVAAKTAFLNGKSQLAADQDALTKLNNDIAALQGQIPTLQGTIQNDGTQVFLLGNALDQATADYVASITADKPVTTSAGVGPS